jgi:hypothetical protein
VTGPGDPVLQHDYGAEARYAVRFKTEPPIVAFEREIARGLEPGPAGADSIVDRRIPPFSRGELPHFAGRSPFLKAPPRVQLVAAGPLAGIKDVDCSPPYSNADTAALMAGVTCDSLGGVVRSGHLPRSEGN